MLARKKSRVQEYNGIEAVHDHISKYLLEVALQIGLIHCKHFNSTSRFVSLRVDSKPLSVFFH